MPRFALRFFIEQRRKTFREFIKVEMNYYDGRQTENRKVLIWQNNDSPFFSVKGFLINYDFKPCPFSNTYENEILPRIIKKKFITLILTESLGNYSFCTCLPNGRFREWASMNWKYCLFSIKILVNMHKKRILCLLCLK